VQRRDLDTDSGTVRVRHAFTETTDGRQALGPPKSRAGLRTVTLPATILPTLRQHLADYVADEPDAFVFSGPSIEVFSMN
jgi:hypothetical protein